MPFINTIIQALGYLEKFKTPLSEERFQKLMEYLAKLSLTKAEKLQVVNMLPKTQVEFYLIVEECEERFTNEQVDKVLTTITDILATVPN